MTFSTDVKNELAALELGTDRQMIAEISALLRTNATVTVSFRDEIGLRFATESAPTARRIFRMIKSMYGYEAQIQMIKNEQLRRRSTYRLLIEDEEISRYLLDDAGFRVVIPGSDEGSDSIGKYVQSGEDELRAFLRGAYLGGGSVTNPSKSYHLEIVVNNNETAIAIRDMAEKLGIKFGITERKNAVLNYMKGAESISDFLSCIGANNAMLELENIRVLKDLRNNVNRAVNCETANINKIVDASFRQVEAIHYIESVKGLHSLPANLREIAVLRLEYPEMSIKELGAMLEKPLAKSGVNHRLKRLVAYAEELKNRENG